MFRIICCKKILNYKIVSKVITGGNNNKLIKKRNLTFAGVQASQADIIVALEKTQPFLQHVRAVFSLTAQILTLDIRIIKLR